MCFSRLLHSQLDLFCYLCKCSIWINIFVRPDSAGAQQYTVTTSFTLQRNVRLHVLDCCVSCWRYIIVLWNQVNLSCFTALQLFCLVFLPWGFSVNPNPNTPLCQLLSHWNEWDDCIYSCRAVVCLNTALVFLTWCIYLNPHSHNPAPHYWVNVIPVMNYNTKA